MHNKKHFTLKKLVLALAIAGYSMSSAYAVLTAPTGTVQGRVPVLVSPSDNSKEHAVDISGTFATTGKLATGDTITLIYKYTDSDGDNDASTTRVTWYYVKGGTESEIATSNVVNTNASIVGGNGTSVLTVPGAALGAEAIKVVIQEYSASGDPRTGETITVADVSNNSTGGETTVPPGTVEPGTNVVPGIYLSTDTAFANNLIGSSAKLDVGNTYVFKLWDGAAVGTTDLTSSVSYNWRLVGTSATDNITAPAAGFATPATDANFTVPVNAAGTAITGSVDGVQGFNLAVDYN
ncbi:SinI family autotransporter-associated protein [Serratia aquatilis]|uniref:SinI family autotransporter-associated protein n=1 Tax=Serratia aquatilis TaxID=1737515 RepID=A0ABV6ED75_9GAMM